MDIAAIFTTSFILGLSGAMMPGPLLAVAVNQSARRGFWAGPLIVLGHAVLELLLVILLVLGLAAVLDRVEARTLIGMVGGVFLLYLGWGMTGDAIRGKVVLDLEGKGGDEASPGGGKSLHPVSAGILLSLTNPYWSMWWATVGLWYIRQAQQGGVHAVSSFYSGHILADLAWYSLVAAVVAGGRRFISQKLYNAVLVVCGLFVMGMGVYFLWDAILNII